MHRGTMGFGLFGMLDRFKEFKHSSDRDHPVLSLIAIVDKTPRRDLAIPAQGFTLGLCSLPRLSVGATSSNDLTPPARKRLDRDHTSSK